MIVRIATRRSPLAMWQANLVADKIRAIDPDMRTEFVSLDTNADQRLDLPIAELGGKGAFSKEIQERVLRGQADIAVHSAKDLQAVTPEGLIIGAIPERGDPRDCLVGTPLSELAPGATVATGSNRRRVQLADLRPDLVFSGLRGNIGRRLEQASDFDAIVMAAVAIERLELRVERDVLSVSDMIPQVGQGALAVECLEGASEIAEILAQINHEPTSIAVAAERAFLIELGGDCDLPAGAHAVINGDQIVINGILTNTEESAVERARVEGSLDEAAACGQRLAQQLRAGLAREPRSES